MANRNFELQEFKGQPRERSQRNNRIVAQIKREIEVLRDSISEDLADFNEAVIAGLDAHLKESAHAKLDGHVKTSFELPQVSIANPIKS